MNLKQTLKALFTGFCFGMGITWLLSVIIPMTMGLNFTRFIQDCNKDIFSLSILIGGLSGIIWLLVASASQKRRKHEELEDAMIEYFLKQNKEQ